MLIGLCCMMLRKSHIFILQVVFMPGQRQPYAPAPARHIASDNKSASFFTKAVYRTFQAINNDHDV
jgi:hypothetical protein